MHRRQLTHYWLSSIIDLYNVKGYMDKLIYTLLYVRRLINFDFMSIAVIPVISYI